MQRVERETRIACRKCKEMFDRGATTRTNCYKCKPTKPKLVRPKVLQVPVGGMATVPVEIGRCQRAVSAELARMGRDETVAGVLAIRLAEMLDGRGLSGPQAATLAKQVQALVQAAISGAKPPEDFVDDLTRRRLEKMSGGAE